MQDGRTNPVYQKILAQNGLAEFKTLIKKWEALSENIEHKPAGAPIILPDLFLVSHSGTGRTHILKLLSEYLSEKPNLMDFYGDVKYFEFMLNYCAPNEYFSEIQRLMTEINNAAGFRSEYRGIVYIDVDEWRGHFEEKHFVSFMEYLSDNSDDWLVVLSVSNDDQEQLHRMEAFVSAFIRIEKITIEPPTLRELTEYAKRILKIYGITLSSEAEGVVSDSIDELCKNKYFDGYKTIKMLSEDIVYSLYVAGFDREREVDPSILIKFSKNSEYIRRMIVQIEKTKKIGF
ncbi:MAG: hypothetical protein E7620_02825 [Ruminococcaceae bacterium]|nr:hypothetical protein [Oscillospiraceae bacterium]